MRYPLELHSDQGWNFESRVLKKVCDMLSTRVEDYAVERQKLLTIHSEIKEKVKLESDRIST